MTAAVLSCGIVSAQSSSAVGKAALPGLRQTLLTGTLAEKLKAIATCREIVEPETLELLVIAFKDADRGIRRPATECFTAVLDTLRGRWRAEFESLMEDASQGVDDELRARKKALVLQIDGMSAGSPYSKYGGWLTRMVLEIDDPSPFVRRQLVLDLLHETGAADVPPESEDQMINLCGNLFDTPSRYAITDAVAANPDIALDLARRQSTVGRTLLITEIPGTTAGLQELALAFSHSRNSEFRAAAVEALGAVGSNTAVERLIAMTRDKSPRIRFKTVRTLGDCRALKALGQLRVCLRDPDESVAYRAQEAIDKILGDDGR